MCLLTTQPEGVVFDDDFLKGVYNHNSDGIGVMYSENNVLHVRRMVPRTEKEFIQFFRTYIDGRACSWHARMKTHGHIDLTNCHPYQVLSKEDGYPLYLAHNGVLHTGNDKDKSKSDTWHYIQTYLRPMLLKNPEFFMTEAFEDLISEHIGSGNKFVLMDAYGNQVTINEYQGVKYKGAWLSNTYAWDTTGTEHEPKYHRGATRWPNYGGSYGYAWPNKSSSYSHRDFGGQFGYEEEEWPNLTRLANIDGTETDVDDAEKDAEGDDAIDFACELFDSMEEMKMDGDAVHFDDAVEFYTKCGPMTSWGIIEAIKYGAYTEAELVETINDVLGIVVCGGPEDEALLAQPLASETRASEVAE